MEELRDANGLTEKEFLEKYDVSVYERPSVTVDVIIIKDDKVLLIKRGRHPSLGKLAFPGGFLEMTEDVYTAAARELFEETSLKVRSLRQLRVASKPDRDPRTRIITVPFLADISNPDELKAGDDAAAASWYTVSRKAIELNGVTVYEITLVGAEGRFKFKVSRSFDKSGFVSDPIYKSISDHPFADDHGEILAYALDEYGF